MKRLLADATSAAAILGFGWMILMWTSVLLA